MKNKMLTGTLILTLAGFLTRIMGFFYKIYLSNALSARDLGVYQLVFPIYGICFTLYASGIQTAISQLSASHPNKRHILHLGMLCSVSLASLLSVLVYFQSDFLATLVLLEPSCSTSLKVLACVFPFCGMTACINGYYYGQKKTAIPATNQLLEQIVRILSVYGVSVFLGKGDVKVTCELAVFGVVLGEIAADLFSIASLLFSKTDKTEKSLHSSSKVLKRLFSLALPLTATRLVITLLNSGESILIPYMLKVYGLSSTEALSVYGILHGMAMPFILFPTAITNAIAVLLLPTISKAQGAGGAERIRHIGGICVKYSILTGLLSTCIFLVFGDALGTIFFHNSSAGGFMRILSWLCPFLYLSTTLGSIINGLGKTKLTFFNTVTGLIIRIAFLFILVPKQGIYGYLTGLLVSQLSIALLDFLSVNKNFPLKPDAVSWILKPGLCLLALGFFTYQVYGAFSLLTGVSLPLLLFLSCVFLCLSYLGFLLLCRIVKPSDFYL
jgi:stage V sporulation protein B